MMSSCVGFKDSPVVNDGQDLEHREKVSMDLNQLIVMHQRMEAELNALSMTQRTVLDIVKDLRDARAYHGDNTSTIAPQLNLLGGVVLIPEENEDTPMGANAKAIHELEFQARENTTIDPASAKFLGKWTDPAGAWYSGVTILITADAWRPLDPVMQEHKTATYSRLVESATEWKLIETRSSGQQRMFSLAYDASQDQIKVSFSNSQLNWILHRVSEVDVSTHGGGGRMSAIESLLSTKGKDQKAIRISCEDGAGTCITNLAKRIEQSQWFETVFGIIIVANAVTIGLQCQLTVGALNSDTWMDILNVTDSFFLVIYVLELMIRGLATGMACDWFNVLDSLLIVITCVFQWFLPDAPDSVMILRSFRLLRLFRALRMYSMFSVAWKLTRGLIASGKTIMSTLAMMTLMIYVFAVLGVNIIGMDEELNASEHFGHLGITMVSLIRFVTVDGMEEIYTPLVTKKPWLLFYFLPMIAILSIVFMNLVLSVIVEGAFEQTHQDKELHRLLMQTEIQKLQPICSGYFRTLDKDGSGQINYVEIEHLNWDEVPDVLVEYIKPEVMLELFEVLDADGSGSVDEHEFVDGLLTVAMAAFDQVPAETVMLLKMVHQSRKHNKELFIYLQDKLGKL